MKFQLVGMLESAVIFTGIYLFFYFTLILIDSLSGAGRAPEHYVSMSFCSVAIVFIFICFSVTRKGLFNNLLLFGNTRSTISAAFTLCCVVISALFGVLSILSDLLNNFMASLFHFNGADNLLMMYSGKSQGSIAENFLWFFALLLILSSIASLYGALNYKIGKKFTVLFWHQYPARNASCIIALLYSCCCFDLNHMVYRA
jgi:hypothetical protein